MADAPVKQLYTYRAAFVRAIDGDTYELEIDLGFRSSISLEVRLRGVDTPERRGETKEAGNASTLVAEDLLKAANTIVIVTHKDRRSFTRWVADVWLDGVNLADTLVERGAGVRV